MMFKLLLLLLSFPFLVNAQVLDSLDTYDHKEFDNQTLKVFSDSGVIQLQVINPSLIKVSFSKKRDLKKQETLSRSDSVYVRITQNLESIFMQTEKLLVIINKLDFSIKFQNLKEQLYAVNQRISFTNDGLNLIFSRNKDELLHNSINKKLKLKKYSLQNLKSVHSSKDYELSFDKASKGSLDFRNSSVLNLKLDRSATFGYYFKAN